MRRAERVHQTFQPHRDWQTHEWRVSFYLNSSPSNRSGYMLRLYREGFELAPGGAWDLTRWILYMLDRATGPMWALRYSEIAGATLFVARGGFSLGRLELVVQVEEGVDTIVLISRRAGDISTALESYGIHVVRSA